jgi:AcrR family transcriptional regulator
MSLTKVAPRSRAKAKEGYHHGDLETALLVHAKKLISQNGVENLSLRQVAAKVGVSPSAAYHHFPDKDALLRAAAKSAFEDMAEFQVASQQNFKGTSALAARKRFRALGISYVGFAQTNPHLFRLSFGPYCGGDEMARGESRPWQLLVASLDQLMAAGEIHPRIRPHAEVLVWSAIHGAATLILDELLPEAALESILDAIEISLKSSGKVGNK